MRRLWIFILMASCGYSGSPLDQLDHGPPPPSWFGLFDDMVTIPAGEFIGRALECDVESETRRILSEDEMISARQSNESYQIDRRVTTCDEFRACLNAGACDEGKARCRIVEQVLEAPYSDAEAYCRWRGKSVQRLRHWQRAARSTDGRVFATGTEWQPPPPCGLRDRCLVRSPDGLEYAVWDHTEEWTSDIDCEFEGRRASKGRVLQSRNSPLTYGTYVTPFAWREGAIRCVR